MQDNAGAVDELAALCVKGKRERLAPRLQRARTDMIRKLGASVITMQHTDVVHTYRAQARRKRIRFTEFLTLLRLLIKNAFMNRNKRLVLRRPFKSLQGRCRVVKALAFGSGLYHTATTLPVLNGRLRTRRYPFIPLLLSLIWFIELLL